MFHSMGTNSLHPQNSISIIAYIDACILISGSRDR